MALILNLTNYGPNNLLERAQLSQDAVRHVTSLAIDNVQGFAPGDFILLGKPGSSNAAIFTISDIDTVTNPDVDYLNINATSSYYERGAPVTKLYGDCLNVYYAAVDNPIDSDYQLLNQTPIPIDADQLTTQYTTPDGFENYWYKFTYVNSVGLNQTALSAATPVRDTSSTDYTNVDIVRQEAGFANNSNVTNALIYRKLQAAQSKINGMLSGRYVLPLGQPVNPTIVDLTVRLAAGYVMIAEYGTFDGQDKSKGEKLRDDAIAELTAYQDGSQIITDLHQVSLELPDAGGFESGYSSDNPAGFSRDDIVGYNERVY